MKKTLALLMGMLFFNPNTYALLQEGLDNIHYVAFNPYETEKTLMAQAKDLDPKILDLALKAYQCASKRGYAKRPVLTIVDYSKPSTEKRMWIFDIAHNKLTLEEEVTHGQGSGANQARLFSNKTGTHASSLGLYQTANVYHGEHGLSLRLLGLEPGYNDHAYSRAIVVHGADYVNAMLTQRLGRLGQSWGCFAVSRHDTKPTIDAIKDGSLLFAYYPDKKWLKHSQFLQC